MLPIVLVLALSGCTAALTSKQVSATVNVSAPTDTLIGDPVKLEATAILAAKRTDVVVLRLQSSTDGTAWTTIAHKTAKGPKLSVPFSLVEKTAATVKYRATVTATSKSTKPLAASAVSTVTTSDIKQLVRTFYYNQTHAFDGGSAAGIAYESAHDSAIYTQTAPSYVQAVAADTAAGEVDAQVPDLTSISPDPTWFIKDATTCSTAMTAPPIGRTFIVTVAFGSSYSATYLPSQQNADVHVTLSNGHLVDYLQMCTD